MQPVPADYPIERLSGPLIVGYLLHWGLFGTLSVQLYLYYLAFPKDRKITKYLVYGIYLVEFVQTILFTHDAFAKFGYGFGDPKALTRVYFNWLTVPIVSAAAACVGQGFYAYRIFILSKSRIIPIFVICVSLTSSVAAIITGVYCFQEDDVTELNSWKMYIAVGIWCGASALCDIIIAICMTYYLMRSNTGFRRTRILVTNLIRLTIETESVTGIYFLSSTVVISLTLLNSSSCCSGDPYRLFCVPPPDFLRDTSDKEFHLPSNRRHTAYGRDARTVVAITKEVLNNDHEMDRMNDGEMSLLA
ncbi:hypothetical protein ARMGADRAFT_1086406 [Armillaria gallica]|uniref:DUF6534 domain-containing protein n=1 Tax=Armillaria gallica TaxID=47427 RepID=A0A2H3CU75_ARMGA|nr:hypothetical protein ARMGADRAFT_1086406 [Armillaria gallica]